MWKTVWIKKMVRKGENIRIRVMLYLRLMREKKSDQEQVKKNVTDGLANKQNDIRTEMRNSELRSGLYYM